jgi:hypothetical protein
MTVPFNYTTAAHTRRHGLAGHADYTSCRPWLRDEFALVAEVARLRGEPCPNSGEFGYEAEPCFNGSPALKPEAQAKE